MIIDTRERREYEGGTPYGETRGGHVPGAVHLHYRSLLRKDGRLRSPGALKRLLQKAGISSNKEIIAYCTGGVRSGYVVAVLAHLGFSKVLNYAGSMWAWAAADAKQHPLAR